MMLPLAMLAANLCSAVLYGGAIACALTGRHWGYVLGFAALGMLESTVVQTGKATKSHGAPPR